MLVPALALLGGQRGPKGLPDGRSGAEGQTPPPSVPRSAEQLIVVTTPGWDSITGTLRMYERSQGGTWQQHGSSWAIVVGRTGLAWGRGIIPVQGFAGPVKHEGDGRAPAGEFTLGTAFGYAPPDSARWLRLALRPGHRRRSNASTIAKSRWYNQVLLRSSARPAPDWNSSEIMRLASDAYLWGVVVEHNSAPPSRATAPASSCISGEDPASPRWGALRWRSRTCST